MVDMEKLSPNEKTAIEELRVRVKNILTPCMLEDTSLFYRFLKARDFDVKKAEIMIQKHVTWRKLLQIDTILEDFTPREFFVKLVQSTVLGFDKEGSLVMYNPSGNYDIKEIFKCVEYPKYMKYWAWYLEKVLKYCQEQSKISGRNHAPLTFIMNMDKLTLFDAADRRLGDVYLNILNLYQNNYPERMKALYIINAPAYATFGFTILKSFMSNALIQKIHFMGHEGWKEKLLEVIDADVLPAFLGGNRTDPDGDPLCKTFVIHGGRIIPEHYHLSDEERYFKNRPGVKKITIPKRDKKEIIVDVKEVESIIRWEFYTKSNINFGLNCRLSDQQEEVIPISKYDTSEGTEKNSYKVRIPGKYIIVFDNSYSWMTSKEVEYIIEVLSGKP